MSTRVGTRRGERMPPCAAHLVYQHMQLQDIAAIRRSLPQHCGEEVECAEPSWSHGPATWNWWCVQWLLPQGTGVSATGNLLSPLRAPTSRNWTTRCTLPWSRSLFRAPS